MHYAHCMSYIQPNCIPYKATERIKINLWTIQLWIKLEYRFRQISPKFTIKVTVTKNNEYCKVHFANVYNIKPQNQKALAVKEPELTTIHNKTIWTNNLIFNKRIQMFIAKNVVNLANKVITILVISMTSSSLALLMWPRWLVRRIQQNQCDREWMNIRSVKNDNFEGSLLNVSTSEHTNNNHMHTYHIFEAFCEVQ